MNPINKYLSSTWEPIEPFSRADKEKPNKKLKDGESEYDVCSEFVHVVEWDGKPPLLVELELQEIEQLKRNFTLFRENRSLYRSKCFLWIIDNDSIKIAREQIRNSKRAHDSEYICHTNLSGAGKAYIGGEIFFGKDDFIYINHFSDRYGGTKTPPELWEAAKKVFCESGFENIIDFLEMSYD